MRVGIKRSNVGQNRWETFQEEELKAVKLREGRKG